MLSANQIAGFLNFNISKPLGVRSWFFTFRYISVTATNWWYDFRLMWSGLKLDIKFQKKEVKKEKHIGK